MTKRAPFIGITTYHRDEKGTVRLPGRYADAVREAGGIPLLLQAGETRIGQLMEILDGLILAGGGDVDPIHYMKNGRVELDEENLATLYSVDQERDDFELELVNRSLDTQMPLLCICRGIQVLNVALGGSLVVDIPNAVPNAIKHKQPPDVPNASIPHAIQISDDSHLARIMQTGTVTTASWHHQSIDKVAPGLEVVGVAPDGVIEAVEMPDNPQLAAVQWHPELTAAEDVTQQRLFDELVRWAGE